MGKIIISTNMTLDGVVQDPDGAEGFGRGGWFTRHGGADYEEWGKAEYDEALRAAALLLGRRSEAWFAARWASRPGEWADRLNALPKYVVSATLDEPGWANVTVLKGDVIDHVTRLKKVLDGDILVYASYRLGRALLEHDLVDELRLFVFPVVLGDGERLFGGIGGGIGGGTGGETGSAISGEKPVRLAGSRTVGNGLVHLTYEVVRETPG